ncbi:MAG: DUF4296 domain-containing protein [Bacteroidaceae bacterium]|nr:DUF4296 domain-containing protein [Bacteroidaceae bacterium]
MKFMRTIPLCIMVLFLMACIAACGPSRPDGVLSDSKMEEVLYDYHKAKALGELESPSNKYKATLYYLNVFEKHHTTEQEFDSSLSWYSRNPEAFDRVYQRVIRRIEGEKKVLERSISISGQGSSVTQSGDSVNIWTGMPMFSLTNRPYDNRIAFDYENDANYEEYDTLHFNARFRYLHVNQPINSKEYAVMALSIRYRNDSIISQMHYIYGDGKHKLTLQSDKNGRIREVYGFIYLPEQSEDRMLLVDSVSLIRMHAKQR